MDQHVVRRHAGLPRIQELPDVFIAGIMGLKRRDLFKVAEADRQDVEVKLA